jgi:hypothetical protein
LVIAITTLLTYLLQLIIVIKLLTHAFSTPLPTWAKTYLTLQIRTQYHLKTLPVLHKSVSIGSHNKMAIPATISTLLLMIYLIITPLEAFIAWNKRNTIKKRWRTEPEGSNRP